MSPLVVQHPSCIDLHPLRSNPLPRAHGPNTASDDPSVGSASSPRQPPNLTNPASASNRCTDNRNSSDLLSVNSLSPTHKSPRFINTANPPAQDHDSALGTPASSGSRLIQDHSRKRFHTLEQKTLNSTKHRKAKWGPSRYDHLFPIHPTDKGEFVVPYNHSQSNKEAAQ